MGFLAGALVALHLIFIFIGPERIGKHRDPMTPNEYSFSLIHSFAVIGACVYIILR